MALDLSDKQKKFIVNTLKSILPDARFLVFGSRVKGTATPYSDLDLAILTSDPLPLTTLSQLAEAFENSDLTFKVDLVDWHRITDEFRAHIKACSETLQ